MIDATSSESSLEDETGVRMVALFDHEEVGSNSAQGAGSPAMLDALSRVTNCFSSDSKVVLFLRSRFYLKELLSHSRSSTSYFAFSDLFVVHKSL